MALDGQLAHQQCRDQLLGDYFDGGMDTSSARRLLDLLHAAGSPLDVAFCRASDLPASERHRAAALLGMSLFARRLDCYFNALSSERGTSRDDYFAITVTPELAAGRAISREELLGDGFDLATRSFSLPESELMNAAARGLVYAACTAPYGVVHPERVIDAVLAFLDWLPGEMIPFQWSDDWNYFAPGLEWWGAFYWTVELPARGLIVCIGASTTD